MSALQVKDLMTKDVETLFDDETLDLARSIMNLGRIRHLPVVTRDDRLVGLVTHRDMLRASALALGEGMDDVEVKVADIMTTNVASVPSSMKAIDAGEMMLRKKYGCLTVVDDDTLVGIVTEADYVDLALRYLGDPGA